MARQTGVSELPTIGQPPFLPAMVVSRFVNETSEAARRARNGDRRHR